MEPIEEKSVRFSFSTWKRLIKFISGFKRLFLQLIFLTAAMAAIDISLPLLQGYLINNFIGKNTVEGIVLFTVIYSACFILLTFFIIFYFRLCIKLEMEISRILRAKIFKKFQELPVGYYNNRSVGYLVATTMSDTERISNIISWGTLNIGWSAFTLVGIFIPMMIINYKLALIVMLIVPCAFIISFLFESKLLKMNRKIRKLNSEISGALNEGITGAKTIKTLNVEQKMTEEFKHQTKNMYDHTYRYNRRFAMYVALLITLGSFVMAAILSYGSYQVNIGMSIGELAIFISYAAIILDPAIMLAEGITNLVANQANVERTLKILEEVPQIIDTQEVIEKYGDSFNPKYENWEPMLGEIEFKNVSFKYPQTDKYILKDFNLKIPKGSSLALVGETGAGKTTIVNLICRFYEPTEGQILIDGIDIKERSQLWLSRNLGYVLQTPHLFSGTIKDNIKYSKPEASDEQMQNAAELVSADKVIAKLEKGYDSQIGECGDTLSTGEKQLITFARALLADPKIVILDEATANIDTETEHIIQSAIKTMLNDRTSVIIAHRLSTIKNSDTILLVENGKIVEQGSHKELMQMHGGYYKLYMKLFEMENNLSL